MKKLILHIGAPKCGSTALQSVLEIKERNGDLNKVGFTFPLEYARGSTGQGNAGPIFQYFRQANVGNLKVASDFLLRQTLSTIISEEMIFGVIDKNKLANLLKEIKNQFHEIVVVIAIRKPSSWLLSDYSEHIKKNVFNQSFPEHVVKRENCCNWLSYFSRFVDHNLDLRIVACDYEKLFDYIAEILGVEREFLSTNDEKVNANFSLTPAQLEAKRICNILEIKDPAKIKQLELIYQDFNLKEENKSFLKYIDEKYEGYVDKIKALKDVFFYGT
jgi:hypothetical protein